MEAPPAFIWGDPVEVSDEAADHLRPGELAEVVGFSAERDRSGEYLAEFPDGYVYTIEFGDGSSVEAPERLLRGVDVEQSPVDEI